MIQGNLLRLHFKLATALLIAAAPVQIFAANSTSGLYAVVSGGDQNTASGDYSVIAGGLQNTASQPPADPFNPGRPADTVIGGGQNNLANDFNATVGGGINNTAGYGATVAGGSGNTSSSVSSVGGGFNNSATGYGSTIPGGGYNQAGADYSFAAGYGAHVRTPLEGGSNDLGTFVWSDHTANPPMSVYTSTGANQFLVRANGGFALNGTPVNANVAMTVQAPASNPGYASIFLRQSNSDNGVLVSSGDASLGLTSTANNAAFYVDQYNGSGHTRRLSVDGLGNFSVTAQAFKPGGGAWAASSDARLKSNVQPLEHALDRLLALRGVTFEYANPDSGLHPTGIFTGFIAQEVEPTFPNWIGHDPQGYMTVGPQGFEALTVEALRQLKTEVDARGAENITLREQISRQESSLVELRSQVAKIAGARVNSSVAASTAPGGH